MIISTNIVYIALLCLAPILWWLYHWFFGGDKKGSIKELYKDCFYLLLVPFTVVFEKGVPFGEKCKVLGGGLFLAGIALSALLLFGGITKYYLNRVLPVAIVVEDNGKGRVDYSEYYCIVTHNFSDGKVISGQLGKTVIVNCSSVNIEYYSVTYSSPKMPHYSGGRYSQTVPSNGHIQVDHYPDYIFERPPRKKRSWGLSDVVWGLTIKPELVMSEIPFMNDSIN